MVPTRYSVTAALGDYGAARLGAKAYSRGKSCLLGRPPHGVRPFGDGRSHLSFDVGDAETAADAALGEPVLHNDRHESGDLLHEGGDLEDLAADVRVNADEFEARQRPERVDGLRGRPRGQ